LQAPFGQRRDGVRAFIVDRVELAGDIAHQDRIQTLGMNAQHLAGRDCGFVAKRQAIGRTQAGIPWAGRSVLVVLSYKVGPVNTAIADL
jgi:hypothetical protein